MKKIPTYCFQCTNGPDPLNVIVEDGVAVGIEPNPDVAPYHPGEGKVCPKAYGLIHKLYNPFRIKSPLVRTNPRKGWDEDPKWKEISWDEALDLLAEKLSEIRKKGNLDEQGRPRLAVTTGSGGTPEGHWGSFPAFLVAFGLLDLTVGGGQGIKCYHCEHIYSEIWHRSFIAAPDTPNTKFVMGFGPNVAASRGAAGNRRHAEARVRGYKRIQIEPHISATVAVSDEWIPIKPKTDAAFLYAMIHVVLHEMDWHGVCDIDFLKKMTNSPYLVGPNGYFLRDSETKAPLIYDPVDNQAKVFNDRTIKDFALEGEFECTGVEIGPDNEEQRHEDVKVKPVFQLLLEHTKKYTPEWASEICDVPAETIRKCAREFVENSTVGATIEIDGEILPLRQAAIELGKTVNNGWGGFQVCWARSVLAILTGSLEVPGGTVGIGARINPPAHDNWQSIMPSPDGFMLQSYNSTEKGRWPSPPHFRSALTELTPLTGMRGWAQAISGTTLSWIFMDKTPENWPEVKPPDVWIVYRTNPLISFPDRELVTEVTKKFPFIVSIGYTMDETTWFADLVLPDHTDLEGLQLFRLGGLAHTFEAFWEHYGFALKQPVVKPPYNTKDMTDIWTELVDRLGILDRYNGAINRGLLGAPLKDRLEPDRKYTSEEIWDHVCKGATSVLSGGSEERDLEWFKEHGFYFVKFPKKRHYLHPIMVKWDLRYELPYQEGIKRVGEELERRLHEKNIHWWDKQLEEYPALPECEDFSKIWEEFYGPGHDLWAISTKSLLYAHGSNMANPLYSELSKFVPNFPGVKIHPKTAEERGIKDGNVVIVEAKGVKVEGVAMLCEGVRPDCVVFAAQFGHRVTPFAKDLKIPNINDLTFLDLKLVDAIGGVAEIARVSVKPR